MDRPDGIAHTHTFHEYIGICPAFRRAKYVLREFTGVNRLMRTNIDHSHPLFF